MCERERETACEQCVCERECVQHEGVLVTQLHVCMHTCIHDRGRV